MLLCSGRTHARVGLHYVWNVTWHQTRRQETGTNFWPVCHAHNEPISIRELS